MRRPIGRHSDSRAESLWERLNLGSPEETAWMADALCAQTDPDAFFPDKGEPNHAAKAVCAACPVRSDCLAYALDRDERYGIWGGLSAVERRTVLLHQSPPADDGRRAA